MQISEDVFDKVCMQRDALKLLCSDLCNAIVNGVHNNMLNDKAAFHSSDDSEKKCHKGYSRGDVKWNVGYYCVGCEEICRHVSCEEKRLFESLHKAKKEIKKPDADMPDITPDQFVKYEPFKYNYEATPRWIARNLYKLCIGYWVYSDHSDYEKEIAWRTAFDDTLSICLGVYGKEFSALAKALNTINNESEAESFKKDNPDVIEFLEKMYEQAEKFKDVSVSDKSVDINKKITLLMIEAVTLRSEYRFAHNYPGGDIDVYDGAFGAIIGMCLTIAGFDTEGIPQSYEFDDKDEYVRRKLEFNMDFRKRLYSFIEEDDGLVKVPIGE